MANKMKSENFQLSIRLLDQKIGYLGVSQFETFIPCIENIKFLAHEQQEQNATFGETQTEAQSRNCRVQVSGISYLQVMPMRQTWAWQSVEFCVDILIVRQIVSRAC